MRRRQRRRARWAARRARVRELVVEAIVACECWWLAERRSGTRRLSVGYSSGGDSSAGTGRSGSGSTSGARGTSCNESPLATSSSSYLPTTRASTATAIQARPSKTGKATFHKQWYQTSPHRSQPAPLLLLSSRTFSHLARTAPLLSSRTLETDVVAGDMRLQGCSRAVVRRRLSAVMREVQADAEAEARMKRRERRRKSILTMVTTMTMDMGMRMRCKRKDGNGGGNSGDKDGLVTESSGSGNKGNTGDSINTREDSSSEVKLREKNSVGEFQTVIENGDTLGTENTSESEKVGERAKTPSKIFAVDGLVSNGSSTASNTPLNDPSQSSSLRPPQPSASTQYNPPFPPSPSAHPPFSIARHSQSSTSKHSHSSHLSQQSQRSRRTAPHRALHRGLRHARRFFRSVNRIIGGVGWGWYYRWIYPHWDIWREKKKNKKRTTRKKTGESEERQCHALDVECVVEDEKGEAGLACREGWQRQERSPSTPVSVWSRVCGFARRWFGCVWAWRGRVKEGNGIRHEKEVEEENGGDDDDDDDDDDYPPTAKQDILEAQPVRLANTATPTKQKYKYNCKCKFRCRCNSSSNGNSNSNFYNSTTTTTNAPPPKISRVTDPTSNITLPGIRSVPELRFVEPIPLSSSEDSDCDNDHINDNCDNNNHNKSQYYQYKNDQKLTGSRATTTATQRKRGSKESGGDAASKAGRRGRCRGAAEDSSRTRGCIVCGVERFGVAVRERISDG